MPKEINFNCSCPHWASMYKDVTAVLYGVDARLDEQPEHEQPELIFRRRRVDAKDLVSQAGADLRKSKHGPAAGKVRDDALLHGPFAAWVAVWRGDFGPRSMTSAGLSAICGTASHSRSPHPARPRFA